MIYLITIANIHRNRGHNHQNVDEAISQIYYEFFSHYLIIYTSSEEVCKIQSHTFSRD